MTRTVLAHELRQRQSAMGTPREAIDACSDAQMIDAYITCSCCGEKQVTRRQLARAIWLAEDVEDFFDLCDRLAAGGRP